MRMPPALTPGQEIALRQHTRERLSVDQQARFGMIPGHTMAESVGVLYRRAECSCGWSERVERRGNAWAQTSKLRKLERNHLSAANPELTEGPK